MKQAGTILPTAASIVADNVFARADKDARADAAEVSGLTCLDVRNVCGEVRYYRDNRHYAVIGRDLLPKWFEQREDGEWYGVKVR